MAPLYIYVYKHFESNYIFLRYTIDSFLNDVFHIIIILQKRIGVIYNAILCYAIQLLNKDNRQNITQSIINESIATILAVFFH